MKKLLLILALLIPVGAHAVDYYDLQHYRITPSTPTNTNTIQFRGDFQLYDDTTTVNLNDATPKVIFYASGTVVVERIEATEVVFHSSTTIFNDAVTFSSSATFNVGMNLVAGSTFYFDGGDDTFISEVSNNIVEYESNGSVLLQISTNTFLVQNTNLGVPASRSILFDATTNNQTGIQQSSSNPDVMRFTVGGFNSLQISSTSGANFFTNVLLEPLNKIYFDGGSNTYITESTGDQVDYYVGGGKRLEMTATNVEVYTRHGMLYGMVEQGVYVGTEVSGKLIDDAVNGGGSTTLYIGNAAITVASDMRLKENIVTSTINATDILSNIRIVDFDWKEKATDQALTEELKGLKSQKDFDKNVSSTTILTDRELDLKYKVFGGDARLGRGKWIGALAQEVVAVAPWVVNTNGGDACEDCLAGIPDDHGIWRIDYDYMVPLLIKAIQELKARIEILEP